ncbi:ATP nucleotide 3'-pyrophosphokinase [Streptomyces lunalinharesii]|uniref:ATP nucleotide 3'-pyrophosphokinase n=1 Tax=Streptomyces lunalinharesii TaxID=333384 RepID=A0ABN3T0K1_9ACTN
MTHHRASRPVTRAALATALAVALGTGAAHAANAAPVPPSRVTAPAPSGQARLTASDGGWSQDGLHLDADDNQKVDAYLVRTRRTERSISPQVRAAALLSHAQLVGFDQRLKSADSLKRKVATTMQEAPGQSVETSLAALNDAVRYTLQWPTGQYTHGVTVAAGLLASWGNDTNRWSNTWGRTKGYKAVNSGWNAPRSGQRFEVQFHTPESKAAQLETHKIYEEQRLPGTPPERRRELQAQQDAIFAAVPVPVGAVDLIAPTRRTPEPVPARAATS